MTKRETIAVAEPEGVDAPFSDDEERAESEWLLARDKDPTTPAPSAKIASDYAEIEHLLGTLPCGRFEPSWPEAVLGAAASSSRPWWHRKAVLWVMSVGGAAAAAAAVLLMMFRPALLEVTTRHVGEARRGADDIVVGDHLVVKARPRGVADLRVYRSDGNLIARSAGGTQRRDELVLDVALDAPGRYHVILVVGMTEPLSEGTMDAYVESARAVHAHILRHPPIDVN